MSKAAQEIETARMHPKVVILVICDDHILRTLEAEGALVLPA